MITCFSAIGVSFTMASSSLPLRGWRRAWYRRHGAPAEGPHELRAHEATGFTAGIAVAGTRGTAGTAPAASVVGAHRREETNRAGAAPSSRFRARGQGRRARRAPRSLRADGQGAARRRAGSGLDPGPRSAPRADPPQD